MIAEARYRMHWARFHLGELAYRIGMTVLVWIIATLVFIAQPRQCLRGIGIANWVAHLPFRVLLPAIIVLGWFGAVAWGGQTGIVLLWMGAMLSGACVPLAPHIWLKAAGSLVALAWIVAGLVVGLATGQVALGAFDLPFLAVAACAILSTVLSDAPQTSLGPSETYGDGLLTVLAYVATGLAVLHLPGPLRGVLLRSLIAAGGIVAVVALLHARQIPWARRIGTQFGWRQEDRPAGTMANPMHLGGYGVLLLPVAGATALQAWPWVVVVLLLGAAIVLSGSRTAWGALVIVGVIWAWARGIPLAHVAVIEGVGLTVLGVAAARYDLGWYAQRLRDLGGLGSRWRMWRDIMHLWAWRPVTGWGFNALVLLRNRAGIRLPVQDTTRDFSSLQWCPECNTQALESSVAICPTCGNRALRYEEQFTDQAHNEVLSWAFSTGVLGVLAYGWLWTTALTHATLGLLLGLIGYGLWLMTGWTHLGPANVLWVFFGLALAR